MLRLIGHDYYAILILQDAAIFFALRCRYSVFASATMALLIAHGR